LAKSPRGAAVRNDGARQIVSEMETRLEARITYERDYLYGLLPELIAELREMITNEINEAVGQLRAEMKVNRTTVTELPDFNTFGKRA
jgi:hypothetical protein